MADSYTEIQDLSAAHTTRIAGLQKLADAGVRFVCTDGIVIEDTVHIAPGALILPGSILLGNTEVGEGSIIGPNSLLNNTKVGKNVEFNASQARDSVIEDGVQVGPFSQLRPASHICAKAHIGDFVEIKNSTVGAGTCVAHLTYVGDADVGEQVNFGCGVAIANYDGEGKNRTVIGDYAFIGCNTNLVAPVEVGRGAYTAAGSTITENVPGEALGIARAHQVNIAGWAKSKLAKYIEKKNSRK